MSEVVFAMIAAIVGSVMIFLIILALFYMFAWLSIKALKRLKEEWDTQYEESQRIAGIHRRAHDLVNCILEVPFANESIWSHGVAD